MRKHARNAHKNKGFLHVKKEGRPKERPPKVCLVISTPDALPGPSTTKKVESFYMLHIAEQRSERKSPDQRDRDLLLGSLREAATRSRLQTTIFENLGNQLRTGQIDRPGVIERLKQEDLLHLLPGGAR